MTLFLPAGCLNEILEYLKKKDLRSCLLVNRLWCKISVRILWRRMQNFKTLITCLPKKSKAILYKNGIIISTSKPPLFNYTAFIKILCINGIHHAIIRFLRNHQPSTPKRLVNNKSLIITQEIFKMFMNQTSLKILYFEFNISRICHNLQSLKITFEYFISNGLTELISVQKDLKYLDLYLDYIYDDSIESELDDYYYSYSDESDLDYCDKHLDERQSLAKIPNALTKLHIKKRIKRFKNLQHVILPQLQILTFEYKCPKVGYLINFLEINGKNLKKLDLGKNYSFNNSLNLAIANFCTNLKTLRFTYSNTNLNNLDSLKVIFKGCEQLESLDFLCGNDCEDYIMEREFLEMVVEFSPKKFHELKLEMGSYVDIETAFQWGLKTIFKRWANRVPCIPLSLTIITKIAWTITLDERNDKLIEMYKKIRRY
ncbi:4842_t:CDS:2 [Funneliformis caledonium]|uniref:4842_t:CDS:1 n=1 Tax=Funneliformis caledonium TaxID=1117310 RepID=A0A9N9FX30_9GLOM|nr:4842_t:CDS:2 [Funneliformis caledonium]